MRIETRLHQLAATKTGGLRSSCLVIALFAMASVSHGQTYRTGAIEADGVTDIIPYAVNNHGVVVGSADFGDRDDAFRWEDGTLIRLQAPAGSLSSIAADINDDGLIVGTVEIPSDFVTTRAIGAFWTVNQETSTVTILDFNIEQAAPPLPSENKIGSGAFGVNNDGLIVGNAGIDYYSPTFGDRHNTTPSMTNGGSWSEIFSIVAPSTGYKSFGTAFQVNDNGIIMGRGGFGPDRGFIGSAGGGYQILEMLPARKGLNNEGHVVGHSDAGSARMWDGSNYIDLDSSPSQAIAVNDSGIAVGRRTNSPGAPYSYGSGGMLYQLGVEPQYLHHIGSAGWFVRSATDINNEGMIVGVGDYNGEQTAYWMSPSSGGLFLEGTVRDEDGNTMPDLTVIVEDSSGSQDSVSTDADGYYSINLPQGWYSVWIDPWGFKPQSDVCTENSLICRVTLDQPRVVDFVKTSDDTIVISSMFFVNTELIVVFSSEPHISGWIVEGSEDMSSFSDLTSEVVIQEPTWPGYYLLKLDTTDHVPKLFIRIRKP